MTGEIRIRGDIDPADVLAVIDALARLQLAAKRCCAELKLERAPREVLQLIEFVGLDGVIGCGDVDVETRRQPEQREQTSCVEEERDARDLSL